MLDTWLGKEAIIFLREQQLKGMIEQHIEDDSAEIDYIEGRGALNFLDIDDIPIAEEGQEVDPASLVALECKVDLHMIPVTPGSVTPGSESSARVVTLALDSDPFPAFLLPFLVGPDQFQTLLDKFQP
ncbi:hypothetical protein ACFL1V_03975 [Pseudomonadota bacterium]